MKSLRARPKASPSIAVRLLSTVTLVLSLLVTGILGFSVDALRRVSMSVPWPIILVSDCLTNPIVMRRLTSPANVGDMSDYNHPPPLDSHPMRLTILDHSSYLVVRPCRRTFNCCDLTIGP